jgi:hypothetical protein
MSHPINNHKIEFIYELKCYQHKRMNADAPKPRPAGFGAEFIGVMWALAHRKVKYSWACGRCCSWMYPTASVLYRRFCGVN